MIYSIVETFKECALRNKAVLTFKYQDQILINAQPNNKHYSVIIETDPMMNFTKNGVLTLNMDVLSSGQNELEIQDIASQIGLSILLKVGSVRPDILNLLSYSILFFTKRTDDMCAGCRFTIQYQIPEFIDYCTMDEAYLNDEEYAAKLEAMKDKDLDLGTPKEHNGLDLNPLKV